MRKKKSRVRKPTRNGAPAKPSRAVANDPVLTSVKALMRPFDVEKGVAAPLVDGRPAQKFMAKAQTQITLAAGKMMAFMVCPNAANDASAASVIFLVGTANAGRFDIDGFIRNGIAGVNIWGTGGVNTIIPLSTNTPYSQTTLSGNSTVNTGVEYACVGNGLKFTYEGAELYRGGTLRYIYDREGGFNHDESNWTNRTGNNLVDYVNNNPNTIRQSINKDNVVEINCSPEGLAGYFECLAGTDSVYGADDNKQSEYVGGASPTTYFGVRPTVIGYYVNTSGNTISFHIDTVEHWAMSSPIIQSLQTPSYAHTAMATHVSAVMGTIRQQHAGSPNVHHATVAKETVAAMKSPIGHELLNVGIRAALA